MYDTTCDRVKGAGVWEDGRGRVWVWTGHTEVVAGRRRSQVVSWPDCSWYGTPKPVSGSNQRSVETSDLKPFVPKPTVPTKETVGEREEPTGCRGKGLRDVPEGRHTQTLD